MTKLDNINYPDGYECNLSLLNELKEDLNDNIDHLNQYSERCQALCKRALTPPEPDGLFEEIHSLKSHICGLCFIIRDRVRMIESEEMFRLYPDEVQIYMRPQLDFIYEKCKNEKNFY